METKRTFKIAVLPGDGIGREVLREGLKILNHMGQQFGLQFETQEHLVGGAAIDSEGTPLPEETRTACLQSDAVFFGAVGGPKWDDLEVPLRPERGLLALRKDLDLFANLRPVFCIPELVDASTLKREIIEGVDLLVIRELTSGLYFGEPRGIRNEDGVEKGINTLSYTRPEVERVARLAFETARRRTGRLHSVDKANVLESSQLWRQIVTEIGREFPDVELIHLYVDNCAMQLIRDPKQFDVLVTTNMFGDILSDEAAMLTGSLGMLPSASLGGTAGLYEPVHGSAPDIAGQDKANPLAMILTVAMMFEHKFRIPEGAKAIRDAVGRVLAAGYRTADTMQPGMKLVGTTEMGEKVLEELAQTQ